MISQQLISLSAAELTLRIKHFDTRKLLRAGSDRLQGENKQSKKKKISAVLAFCKTHVGGWLPGETCIF